VVQRGHARPTDYTGTGAHRTGEDTGDAVGELLAADPACALAPGVPYARRWCDAAGACEALRRELAACGLADSLPHLRPDVMGTGAAVVELGRVTPATARLLAEALARARRGTAPSDRAA
jgi:hypothetical protein